MKDRDIQAAWKYHAATEALLLEVRICYRIAKLGGLGTRITEDYAVSAERKIRLPAATVIAEVAKNKLFGASAS